MSKIKTIVILGLFVGVVMLLSSCNRGDPYETIDIRSQARQASVQTVFHIPVIRISYTTPLPEPEEPNIVELLEAQEDALQKKIDDALKKFIEEQKVDRWESSLTDIETWNYDPEGKTWIPLGQFTPKEIKFPERVLVVRETKVEEEEISPWEKEYEGDVLAISETANVSPSKAKEILTNIKNKGYTISKGKVEETDNIKLLHFTPDWSDKYPVTLDWKVEVIAGGDNLIVGYDPRGILEIKPVFKDTKLHIKAGYHALKDKFKEEPSEVTNLKAQLETLRENLKVANEEIEELKEKDREPIPKRDITTATMWDLKLGVVEMEQFFFMSAASGVFLGNMQLREEMRTYNPLRGWGWYKSDILPKKASVYLTNAHVADMAQQFQIMVDEDRENMWILFPGSPSIRHTKDSDYFGTPASILQIDLTPVISWDIDAGILVSSPVPTYEKFKVKLGNSDNVRPGDPIVTVGNPAGMQKFTSEGIISNTEYSMLDALDGAYFLKWLSGNKPGYSWMLNSNFWIDCSIGIGGVSGSGVWATQGSEMGKMVAIRNAGMMRRYARVAAVKTVKESIDWDKLPDNLSGLTQDHARYLFKSLRPSAGYTESFDSFLQEHNDLTDIISKQHHGHMPISGMNIGVPINLVKTFLQERGLDPEHFGWMGLDKNYWVK